LSARGTVLRGTHPKRHQQAKGLGACHCVDSTSAGACTPGSRVICCEVAQRGARSESGPMLWNCVKDGYRKEGARGRRPGLCNSKRMVRKSYRPGSQFLREGPAASWLWGLSVRFEPRVLQGDTKPVACYIKIRGFSRGLTAA